MKFFSCCGGDDNDTNTIALQELIEKLKVLVVESSVLNLELRAVKFKKVESKSPEPFLRRASLSASLDEMSPKDFYKSISSNWDLDYEADRNEHNMKFVNEYSELDKRFRSLQKELSIMNNNQEDYSKETKKFLTEANSIDNEISDIFASIYEKYLPAYATYTPNNFSM